MPDRRHRNVPAYGQNRRLSAPAMTAAVAAIATTIITQPTATPA
jgi:hypothetical protein